MTTRMPTAMVANGPPPDAAAGLYVGQVMHQRLRPFGHRFAYRVANLVVDLDRLAEADRLCRLFSVERFNLFSFSERDHGPRDGSSLRGWIDGLMAEAGLAAPARVLLVCYPRVAGYVFDPISVYFAYDAAGAVIAVVYQVHNTFGETHTYVAPVRPEEASPAGIRQARDKLFHVSPFMPMEQRYGFSLLPPGEGLRIRILETDADGPILAATFAGRFRPMTSAGVLKVFAALPFQSIKVVAGIHYEAARLWLKGATYHMRPAPPAPVSHAPASRDGGPFPPREILRTRPQS